MSTKLTLIRHGITNWNKQKRYCGSCDVPLSRQGRSQAQKLHTRLRPVRFDTIYVSDKKRAIQTAQIIFKGERLITMAGLKELNFGVLEGLRYREIIKKYPEAYTCWLKNPFKNAIPKAESLNSFKERVMRTMQTIVRRNSGKNIAIVCHGGVISIFMAALLQSDDFWRHIPTAASITIVEYKNNVPTIKLFNCSKHLD